MVSLKNRSKGFTIVELLIVIVVIAILATLVIVTFTGIQQKARDSQRQTDINAVDSHVEAYYAQNGTYPTAAMLNDATWRAANMKGLDAEALKDPKASGADIGSATATATTLQYGYVATAGGAACPAATGTGASMVSTCDAFTLTAYLEGGTTYTKKSN
jgi:prepilin-type N-terminal cleavage/methylation domain-containing protein